MSQKRAPGAGRKPMGDFTGKSATFTTRITAATRTSLERGAREKGHSLSQYVELLLKNALRQSSQAEKRNRALGAAITILAENVERDTGENWKDDPFTGLALRYAVEALLFRFAAAPSDTATIPPLIEETAGKMPEEFGAQLRKPAGLGHLRAFGMIHELESAIRFPDDWTAPIYLHLSDIGIAESLARDLGPDEGGKEERPK